MSDMIETIDICGARAILDALGHRRASKMIRKIAISKGYESLPCIDKDMPLTQRRASFTVHGGHATFTHPLDADGRWMMEDRTLTIRGGTLGLPDTVMAALKGQPITVLTDHFCFDPSMTILEVDGADGPGATKLRISHTRRPLEEVLEALNRLERP